MSANTIRKLQDWLTIDEAARELSEIVSDGVAPADVLRLAIDGHLRLSLYLPVKVTVRCQRIADNSLDPPEISRAIEGLCDVPMSGRGKSQIEHEYQWLRGNYVPTNEPVGAFVEHGELICRVPPDKGATGMSPRAPSEFPRGSVPCVRRTALEDFVSRHAASGARSGPKLVEKSRGERERTTLLTIIAALAKAARIDISTPSKAGQTIEALTTELGARVSGRTVESHLNRVADALERRGRDSV